MNDLTPQQEEIFNKVWNPVEPVLLMSSQLSSSQLKQLQASILRAIPMKVECKDRFLFYELARRQPLTLPKLSALIVIPWDVFEIKLYGAGVVSATNDSKHNFYVLGQRGIQTAGSIDDVLLASFIQDSYNFIKND